MSRITCAVLTVGGLLLALLTAPATAGLTGLVYDESTGSIRAVGIDSASGAVTPGQQAIDDCCWIATGMTAVDQAGERLFAFGRDTVKDSTVLLTLSHDGSQAGLMELTQTLQALLAYDSGQDRLISVSLQAAPSATSQWVSIDPGTGVVTPIGDPLADCCEFATGLAAVSGTQQVLYFVGREPGQAEWHLFSTDLAAGSVESLAALPPGRPGFLVLDENSGKLDLLMQTKPDEASGLYRIDPVDGSVELVATQTDSDCCLTGPGQTASLDQDSQFWWIGGSGSGLTPSPGFFALGASSSAGVATVEQLTPGYRLHALVISGAVVNLDLLFQDRFQAF